MTDLHGYQDYINQQYVVAFLASVPERREIQSWCFKTFGYPGETMRWIDHSIWGEVLFNDRADFNWFMLRWA